MAKAPHVTHTTALCHSPKLLPALVHLFPPILELVPAEGMPPPRAPLAAAALAARALARITAAAPLVHDRLVEAAAVMNHTQHVLSTIATRSGFLFPHSSSVGVVPSQRASFVDPSFPKVM